MRSGEAGLTGRALALAVAADRAHHLHTEIEPALADGATVLCDRYVPSSLVLQRLDGVAVADIGAYNRFARIPDLTVYLTAEAATIQTRLAARSRRSRLEEIGGPAREVDLYRQARRLLADEGWPQIVIDAERRTVDEVAARMREHLP
ncbi:dTMP kinase [Thermomonospora umbrina]|uniref:Thymidylate kinase n=1 Tax=Thermomonospora umbrina TaxID=111806 RepID=A0A3D9T664_9ACTN|nr:hypothetical protein [Thermomonospora umbrina]REF00736.1 thymidylate kinase [Thermomonospora umbrina]